MSYGCVTREPAERVILLSEKGKPIGSELKSMVHTEETPLHLAFSIFLFDGKGRTLMQRRASHEKTWGGVWSNACCGHPGPDESLSSAVVRRLEEELGLDGVRPVLALPDFRYRACCDGIWENEFCPVFVAVCSETPSPNPEEVSEVKWVDWEVFTAASIQPAGTPYAGFSPWSLLEASQLKGHPVLARVLNLSRKHSYADDLR